MTRYQHHPDETFDRFWLAYPKRMSKIDARQAWLKLDPDETLINRIIDALAWQRQQPEWTKEGGRYIPMPATWLKHERWTDEPPLPAPPVLTRFASLGMYHRKK